jgi:hypothetical protein
MPRETGCGLSLQPSFGKRVTDTVSGLFNCSLATSKDDDFQDFGKDERGDAQVEILREAQ